MIHAVLHLLPWFGAWLGFYALARELAARGKIDSDRRLAGLLACAGWGATLTAITELTSLDHHFDAPTIWVAWILICLALFYALQQLAGQRGLAFRQGARGWFDFSPAKQGQTWDVGALFAGGLLLLALLGFVAVATPTTTFDALTYHLPRVMHWLQNHSVHQYPTNNSRQNEFGPWAGFVLAQLQLLAGSDRLLNLVQWFALLGSGLGASLIAQRWTSILTRDREPISPNLPRWAGAFAFLLVVTLPIAVVESVTTQNDLVASFWFTTFLWLALFFIEQPSNRIYSLGAGLALGLGALTKSTVYIYAVPMVAAIGLWLLLRRSLPGRWQHVCVLIFTVAALNAPHWFRNYSLLGTPLGSPHIVALERNATASISALVSNLIRNLSLEMNTGLPWLTEAGNALIAWLHQLTGRDLNDAATSYHLGKFFFPDKLLVADSYASNFWHLSLALLAFALVLARPQKKNGPLLIYGGLLTLGLVVFCGLFRWQIWHSRLHMAWLMAAMPAAAVVFASRARRWLIRIASSIVLVAGFYCALHNSSRPILNFSFWDLPREEKYLAIQARQLASPLIQFAEDVRRSNGKDVGLIFQFDDFEQGVWLTLKNRGFTGRIDHLGVTDASARLDSHTSLPSVVLTSLTNDPPPTLRTIFPHRRDYPPYVSYWSEETSHWSDFFKQNFFRPNIPVKAGQDFPFFGGQNYFGFRSVRPGRLKITGQVDGEKGSAISALRVAIAPGAATNVILTQGAFAIDLVIAPSQALLIFSLEPPHTNGVLRVQDWAWAVDAPQGNLAPKIE